MPISTSPTKSGKEYIRLDQFLKVQDLRSSGGAAKWSIQNGEVRVNGDTELRRGRKLYEGDRVECDGLGLQVRFEPSQPA